MQAVVYDHYGPPDVLRVEDVPRPEPRADEVRVRVRAVSINAPDWRVMSATPFLARLHSGLLRPKFRTLGCDIAGTVDAVGPDARTFRIGDEVFGDIFRFGFGGFAEFACAPERAFVRKPAGVSFEAAAATPMAGTTALQALRDHGRLRAGLSVLIAGASGGVGTFAIQIAKHLGARVTAVCSTSKVAIARGLGADRVLDYTREDFLADGTRFDVVLAVNGYRPIRDYRRALAPEGVYLMAGGDWPQLREGLLTCALLSLGSRQRFLVAGTEVTRADLETLGAMLVDGHLTPVIDRRYPLDRVPEAMRYVLAGHAAGKVIIDVAPAAADTSEADVPVAGADRGGSP